MLAQAAHVLIFPLPIQGPVNSMLKLAELIFLVSNGQIHVTFLTTEHVHASLLAGTSGSRFMRYVGFSIRAFSDGLPKDHPRGGDAFKEMVDATESVSIPLIREMLKRRDDSNDITCIIADGLYDFALNVGKEAGVPVFYFDTISPSCLWVYLCLPRLMESGMVPFRGNEDLEGVVSLPGIGSLLRRRDFPDFCRANNLSVDFMKDRVPKQAKQFRNANGIILNTYEDLDAPLLSLIRAHCSGHVYVVGPLHLHLKERIITQSVAMPNSCFSNSLWREDRNCIEWLDQQLPRSVIFCSFGSQMVITKDQLFEFWHGLVSSGIKFLWVKRSRSVIGMDEDARNWHQQVPTDLIEGVKNNGFVASWVPQEEVLSHPSVGCFLTHSGWNSTIESISYGVPMICWPHYVDQLVNSRYVSEVWKIGLDMKDTCNRVIIEKNLRDCMVRKGDEFSQEARRLAKLARRSISEDGSSYSSLDKLLDDMKSLS